MTIFKITGDSNGETRYSSSISSQYTIEDKKYSAKLLITDFFFFKEDDKLNGHENFANWYNKISSYFKKNQPYVLSYLDNIVVFDVNWSVSEISAFYANIDHFLRKIFQLTVEESILKQAINSFHDDSYMDESPPPPPPSIMVFKYFYRKYKPPVTKLERYNEFVLAMDEIDNATTNAQVFHICSHLWKRVFADLKAGDIVGLFRASYSGDSKYMKEVITGGKELHDPLYPKYFRDFEESDDLSVFPDDFQDWVYVFKKHLYAFDIKAYLFVNDDIIIQRHTPEYREIDESIKFILNGTLKEEYLKGLEDKDGYDFVQELYQKYMITKEKSKRFFLLYKAILWLKANGRNKDKESTFELISSYLAEDVFIGFNAEQIITFIYLYGLKDLSGSKFLLYEGCELLLKNVRYVINREIIKEYKVKNKKVPISYETYRHHIL
ncbi:hypothetical protein B5S29_g1543 [[Candida] boidinii]|nr:hypothetical protein B5S29_g1543 [[Candida] boidinii]